MGYATDQALQANQADEDRTKRAFVGFLTAALGVDQTYTNQDAVIASPPGTYIVAAPDGTYSILGQSSSNLNTGRAAQPAAGLNVAGITIPPIILLAGLAWLALRALR